MREGGREGGLGDLPYPNFYTVLSIYSSPRDSQIYLCHAIAQHVDNGRISLVHVCTLTCKKEMFNIYIERGKDEGREGERERERERGREGEKEGKTEGE